MSKKYLSLETKNSIPLKRNSAVEKYKLKNGLTVLLAPTPRAPVVSCQMWVRNGSADEKKGEEGISHFIEHLLFKSTEDFKVGEIANLVESTGGELNAYTSFDQTVFYITLSKQFQKTALHCISQMMGFPQFIQDEVDREREVVVEEIKRGQDQMSRLAGELLFKSSYKSHPYGTPVIGFEKNVRSWSVKKIRSFYESRYVPKNMFLMISGDFEKSEMKSLVQNYFSPMPDFKVRKSSRPKEPVQTKPRTLVQSAPFEQNISYLSWKIPSIKHKDLAALDVFSLLLGQGDSSLLVRKLRLEELLVQSVGASTFAQMDSGLFLVSMSYTLKQFPQALEKLLSCLNHALTMPFSAQQIEKAILNIESEDSFSLETVDGFSRKFGSLEFYFHDLKAQDKYLKEVRALTPEKIQKVALKYLNPKTINFATVFSQQETAPTGQATPKELVQQWIKNFEKQFKKLKIQKVLDRKVRPLKLPKTLPSAQTPKIEKIKISDDIYLWTRKASDTSVFSLRVGALGGSRLESDREKGLFELLNKTWLCGTPNRSESQLSEELESMALGLGPTAGKNSLALGLTALKPFEKKASEIFFDVFLNPDFKTECVEREKQNQIQQIKVQKDQASRVAIDNFLKTLFQSHPYAFSPLGTEASVAGLKRDSLLRIWDQTISQKTIHLTMCGNFEIDFWAAEMKAQFSKLPKFAPKEIYFPKPSLSKSEIIFETSEKEQAHVVYGTFGFTIHDDEKYTLHVLESVLSGMGGRLFMELREKESLAYTVSPLRMEGIDQGYFGAYIGCSPEKVGKSLDLMKKEFEKLVKFSVDQEELGRAKRYLIGRYDIDLQRTASWTNSIFYNVIYGLPADETAHIVEKYQAVTSEKVKALAQKIFSQYFVTSVVGPKDKCGDIQA